MSAPDASDPNTADSVGTEAHPGAWSARNYRALKISVIVMSVLIVLGLIVVFATIVNRMSGSGSSVDTPPLVVSVPPDVVTLMGPDAEVVSTVLDGSRLAVVLKRPEGHAVIVVDLRTGRVLNVIAGASPADSTSQ